MNEPLKTESVLDLRYLVNVLIELQLAVRKLYLYSLSHSLVPSILENLEKQFSTLFEFVEDLSLGITRTEFIYMGNAVSSTNPVIRQLAKTLNETGIASIRFEKGLSKEDLLHFLKFIMESGKSTGTRKEESVSRFHRDTARIKLQLIRFESVLGRTEEIGRPAIEESTEPKQKRLWKDLVHTLMEKEGSGNAVSPEGVAEDSPDSGELARLINQLCETGRSNAKSYERTIVTYLNNFQEREEMIPEDRVQFNRELSKLLARLEPDIRQQIFRISLEESGREKGPFEEALTFFSEPMLLELFNQIHLSNHSISSPMVSLLNKFTELSGKNNQLPESVAAKLNEEKNIFREILTSRANREYYPMAYRTFLDQELVQKPGESPALPGIDQSSVTPETVNYHLALILTELIEGDPLSDTELDSLFAQIDRLLQEGCGDRTRFVHQEVVMAVLKKLESDGLGNRNYYEEKFKGFIKPEFLSSLIKSFRTGGDERLTRLFDRIKEIAGQDLMSLLLDQLETEENLSTRKYLLQQIIQCGKAVIPEVVRRLRSPKWFVVRNMLVLLKELKAKEALPEIERYFREAKLPKVKLAAFQAAESIGMETAFYREALRESLDDPEPGIVRYAVGIALSGQNRDALQALRELLNNLFKNRNAHLVLQLIRNSKATELLPVLEKLRRRLRFRFWQGKGIRETLRRVNDTIHELAGRREAHA